MEYVFRGAVGSLELKGCTVVNRGSIVNLRGENCTIENRGTVINNFAVSLQSEQEPKVVYKDRVVYRDRVVYQDRVKYISRDPNNRKALERARELAVYWQRRADELENENRELRADLEDAERQKLLQTIENLQAKLNAARSRENVLVRQRNDAMREARAATQRIWDDFRPSKEACKRLYKNLRAFMDCED